MLSKVANTFMNSISHTYRGNPERIDRVTNLATEAAAGDPIAMDELIRSLDGLAWMFVRRYKVDPEMQRDLHQEALKAIYEAVPRYEKSRASFSTYAGQSIVSALKEYAIKQWALSIPYHAKKKAAQVNEYMIKRYSETGREDVDDSVKEYMEEVVIGSKLTRERIQAMIDLNKARNASSLESLAESGVDIFAQSADHDHSTNPEVHVLQQERNKRVVTLLECLTPKQRQAIELLYLKRGGSSHTEIAQILSRYKQKTRQAIQQREEHAIQKMKLSIEEGEMILEELTD